MKLKTLGMAAAALLMGFGAAQADILIDNYDCPAGFTSLTNSANGSTVNMVTAAPCALGGTREKQISIISGGSNNPPADTLAARASVGFGAFAASTDAGVIVSNAAQAGGTSNTGGYLLRYDANGAGLNTDFSQVQEFAFKVLSNDHPLRVYLTLCSGATGTCLEDTFVNPAIPAPGGTFTHGISNFGPGATAPFLSDIDRIDLRFHSGSGNEIDLVLDNFNATVPEPSTIVLMGAGFAALGLVRFMRQARKNSLLA